MYTEVFLLTPSVFPHLRLFLLTLSSSGVDSLSVELREITSATMVLRKYLQTFILYIFRIVDRLTSVK